jgi:hypothetical protein
MVTATSDSELCSHVEQARRAGTHVPTIALLGGDLMRTIGGTADVARFQSGEALPHLPIDLVRVVADDTREAWFVAHLLARHSWWRGLVVAGMNAQFIGQWDVAPRSHPNDGLIDIVTVSPDMNIQQRWIAKSRVALGTHVPHPRISIAQHASATIELEGDTPLWLDGQRWGSARHLQFDVEPDALVVCV